MNQSLIPASPNEVQEIATSLAASGFFKDATSAQQAFAKVLAGAELGLPAFQSMSGIHIVQGKPQLGAGLIAALIKRSTRYNYRVTTLTDEACNIEFYEKFGEKWEVVGSSSMNIKQAKEANLTVEWDRQNNKWKDKATWKNFPKNMLFARCMSNGAKWYCPDVFGGPVYTEGELDEIPTVVDTTAVVVEEKPKQAKTQKSTPTVEVKVIEEPKVNNEFTNEEIDFINSKLDELEKKATASTTPEEFQEIRKELTKAPLNRLSKEKLKAALDVIIEIAMEAGIDYLSDKKVFVNRETGEVAQVQTAEVVA